MSVKRFAWVAAPFGRVLHMKFGGDELKATKCGRDVVPGWMWVASRTILGTAFPICKRCVP